MYLVTNVFDEATLSEQTAALLYEMRWGVEVFFRSTKQTLEKRKMLSHTPEAAKCELTWAVLGIWLLGWMSVAGMIRAGRDPLRWSAAQARERVREAMRRCLKGQRCPETLSAQLARALKDDYHRRAARRRATGRTRRRKSRRAAENRGGGRTAKACREQS